MFNLETRPAGSPRLHHGFVGTEHVLLGLLALEEGVVPNVLKKMGVDRADVRHKQAFDMPHAERKQFEVRPCPLRPRPNFSHFSSW